MDGESPPPLYSKEATSAPVLINIDIQFLQPTVNIRNCPGRKSGMILQVKIGTFRVLRDYVMSNTSCTLN